MALIVLLLLFPLSLHWTATAQGELYQYVDAEGTVHLTNVPSDPRFVKIRMNPVRRAPRISGTRLTRAIAESSRTHRLPSALIRAVIKAESDFVPSAVSKAGAQGLMQLMPATAHTLRISDPFNPEENIRGGTQYLRYLLDQYRGNLPLALAAYNAGETVVNRHQGIPPIKETQRYVRKVLRFYRQFRQTATRQASPTMPTLRKVATRSQLIR